ncbi:MAG: serine/threonine protein kinase [Tannerella sp.]|jgi:serine/threonine-protein kinase|nr:serine/threonine protein kinase [Tannerella sp.]
MHLPTGHYLQKGKYHITDVIGQGGFGITYLGVWSTEVKGNLGTVRTDVPVCIKEYFFKDYCLRDNDTLSVKVHSETGKILFSKFKEKLIKEAKILSEVHHPYIVNVLEVFEENDTAYIAMEYIQGCSLKYMLEKEGVLPEKKVLKYVYQIGQALEFVHQKSILHLDIKPNNILIDKKNNARLIDFGVSKRYDIEQQETSTTMLTLSKGFAAIEQYDTDGIQNFSPCPDIYSLGATMYNLLTGIIPTESILRATKPISQPSELNKAITPQTEAVIMKAMKINPVKRYQSVRQMLNELDIPSYFEEIENTFSEQPKLTANENDSTTFRYDSHQKQDKGQADENLEKAQARKKRKRRVLIPLFITFVAIFGWTVTYILDLDGSAINVSSLMTNPDSTRVLVDVGNAKPIENVSLAVSEKDTNKANGRQAVSALTTSNTSAEKTPKDTTDEEAIRKNVDNKTEEIKLEEKEAIETKYAALVASGKTKMEQKKYAEAKVDFVKAKDLKVTEEVLLLSIACDDKAEEQRISERKVLYEEKYPFGSFMIVRKISNGRYGAIDSKGFERIEAIYLSVAPSVNGRAFEREDHLYDIYDVNGARVGNGLTSY